MKKNLLPILVLLLLGGAATYFYITNSGSTLKPELTDYAVKDTSAITKIFLADKRGNQILLERKSERQWTVNSDFIARQDGINNLLDAIARVQIKTPINKAAYETTLKQIASAGIKVEIYTDSDSPMKVYYVGGASQDHTGTKMLLKGSSTPHLTHVSGMYGFLTPRYFTSINEWKDRAIFRYQYGEIAKIRVEYPQDPTESFEITDLGNNQFSVLDITKNFEIERYDTLALLEYIARFQNIHYEGFEETKTDIYIAGIKETTPQQIYSVTDKLGNVKVCTTYLKPAHEDATDLEGNKIYFDLERFYASVDGEDFVVIQHFLFDNLQRKLSDFQQP